MKKINRKKRKHQYRRWMLEKENQGQPKKLDYFGEVQRQMESISNKALAYCHAHDSKKGTPKAWDNAKAKSKKMPRGKVYQRLTWNIPMTKWMTETGTLIDEIQEKSAS